MGFIPKTDIASFRPIEDVVDGFFFSYNCVWFYFVTCYVFKDEFLELKSLTIAFYI